MTRAESSYQTLELLSFTSKASRTKAMTLSTYWTILKNYSRKWKSLSTWLNTSNKQNNFFTYQKICLITLSMLKTIKLQNTQCFWYSQTMFTKWSSKTVQKSTSSRNKTQRQWLLLTRREKDKNSKEKLPIKLFSKDLSIFRKN